MKQLNKLRFYIIRSAEKRTRLLVKNKIFKYVGENFFFQSRIIPDEPKLICFGNNVSVASGVTFVTHDVIDKVLNNLNIDFKFNYNCAPIKVGNNVFIGCNTTILPNIRIGNNVIVAAGSVVTKDVPNNCIVAGNPAKKISTFDDYVEKRKKVNDTLLYPSDGACIKYLWDKFNETK